MVVVALAAAAHISAHVPPLLAALANKLGGLP
jgi:hypothetical protein